jgi:hypothetical protein
MATVRQSRCCRRLISTTGNNSYNFQLVTFHKLAFGKFRRHDSIAVVLDNDAPRQKFLSQEKILDGTRKIGWDRFSVGDDRAGIQGMING